MAKKVFRIYDGAEGSGWFNSTKPAMMTLQNINSTDKNGKLATSIPSPFARIDLVKNAFDAVGRLGKTIGSTNNHKLISDALDVAQLFFNFEKVKNKYHNAEIIAWNPQEDIKEAINNSTSKVFGNTLDLFWNQDSSSYNFDKVQQIFILRINHKVVGASSPATMFFAAQDVYDLDLDFKFGNVQLFDSDLESIVERDDAFIKYIYAAYKQPDFSILFSELHEYLSVGLKELKHINIELWNEINDFDRETITTDFSQLCIEGIPPVDICGIPVCTAILNPTMIESNSGFIIDCSINKTIEGYKPLVLPIEKSFLKWTYTNAVWDSKTTVPTFDPSPLNKRILPGQADKYPYLTIGDFLEERLIKLPFSINESKFNSYGFKDYLLPLKPLFFKYFDISDIERDKMISIDTTVPNGIRVCLSIPTKSGKIEYKKLYSDIDIFDRDMHLGLFPLLIDTKKEIPMNYYIGLIDQDDKCRKDIDLEFYNQGNRIENSEVNKVIRLEKQRMKGSYNYKLSNNPEIVRVISDNDVNGFIIPRFATLDRKPTSAKVAIDFGTTNTHIEYKYDGGSEKAFEVKDVYGSLALKTKLGRRKINEELLESEVFPKEIGNVSDYKFPLRSALLVNNLTNWDANPLTFQDSNVSYSYEKNPIQAHHNVITDLKWNNLNNTVEKLKVVHFVEGLLEGVKYKLLADGVSISNTTVKWLYPVSMTQNQTLLLSNIWDDVAEKILGKNVIVEKIPESIAPYKYYSKNMGLMGLTASIDIGGGTSDIAILENEEAKMISSVGFAGNVVVGDAYNATLPINGFYKTFNKKFEQACFIKEASLQTTILDQIVNGKNQDSSNFNNFLFSVDSKIFNYSEELRLHPKMKFTYLVFYAAQAFYLANLMKNCNSAIPANIIFSGSGSKSLDIIDQDTRNHTLTQNLFNFFFNRVYNVENANINIKLTSNPKEITCKGALFCEPIDLKNKIGFWLGGTNKLDKVYYESDLDRPTYEDVSSIDYKDEILETLNQFFDLFDKYEHQNDLNDVYGIDNSVMTTFSSMRNHQLDNYLDKGIEKKLMAANGDQAPITEGLFFYPLVGLLNKLAADLADEDI